jgi:cell wall-associated NlpC family hydrolase
MAMPFARPCVRALVVATTLLAGWAIGPEPAAAATTSANWNVPQQRQVVEAGLMEDVNGSFAGGSRLSATQANAAMAALSLRLQDAGVQGTGVQGAGVQGTGGELAPPLLQAAASSRITVVAFDAMLVKELGLGDVAAHVQRVAVAAGLHPPSYFGSESVARLLELRYEHPVGSEQLDLFPRDEITRAEAAWSLAQVLAFGEWSMSYARQALAGFELPAMTAAARAALHIAASRIGYPYVWGGTTDDTSDGRPHGGFDCSGFAWRVYKVSGLPAGQQILGRTAAEQAGEIAKPARLHVSQLQPGDLLFFGSAHFNSRATEKSITHEGIYLGDNWVIHSSEQGVYVQPLQGGWLGTSFAWGRRVL